jgi:WXXGXW repeat (2 copies)
MKALRVFAMMMPALLVGLVPATSSAQISIGIGISINVHVAPPALPVYVQPPCPVVNYLWVPGYWAWNGDFGYYWVPGVWVAPPQPGLLWTPGYWGWGGGMYGWHAGYWGAHVGFYGGVNYGGGYGGVGFIGGGWSGGVFRYNTAVVNVNTTVIRNVYVDKTVINNTTVINNSTHSSFNGPGGVQAQPSAAEQQAMHEQHFQPTAEQTQHVAVAQKDPTSRFSANHGAPPAAAVARVGAKPIAATNHPTPQQVKAAQEQSHAVAQEKTYAAQNHGASQPGHAAPKAAGSAMHTNPGGAKPAPGATGSAMHANPGGAKPAPGAAGSAMHTNPGGAKPAPGATGSAMHANPSGAKPAPGAGGSAMHTNPNGGKPAPGAGGSSAHPKNPPKPANRPANPPREPKKPQR